MKVTGTHTSSLDRQVTERVNIENFQGQVLMNRRNELGGVRIDRMQYRRWGGQWRRWYGGPSNSFQREGSIIIDPGRRNPWWRGGRRRRHFHFHSHFHFHLRSWKVKVNVLLHKLSVLLRFCCQCLIRPHGESTRKINVQNFKSLYKQLRPGAKIIMRRTASDRVREIASD